MTTAIGLLPIVAKLLPEDWSHYVFPPLDDVFRFIAVLLAGLVTLGLFFVKDVPLAKSRTGRLKVLALTFVLAILGGCLYLAAHYRFVRAIDIPSLSKTVSVTVGFERSDFGRTISPGASDWDLLRLRGTSEEEVRRLWTANSVLLARLALFTSFLLVLLAATAMGSLAVLFDALGPATS